MIRYEDCELAIAKAEYTVMCPRGGGVINLDSITPELLLQDILSFPSLFFSLLSFYSFLLLLVVGFLLRFVRIVDSTKISKMKPKSRW